MLTQESDINKIKRIARKSAELVATWNSPHMNSQECLNDLTMQDTNDTSETISAITIKLRILLEDLQLKFKNA